MLEVLFDTGNGAEVIDSKLVEVALLCELTNETDETGDTVVDCAPLSETVGPVGFAFVVELPVGKGVELSRPEENPEEAADSVLDIPWEAEDAFSDPVNNVLCVDSEPVTVELMELENSVLVRMLLDNCVTVLETLPVTGPTVEVSHVVAVSRMVKVTKTPEDTLVIVVGSVVVTGKVVCSTVLVPLATVELV